MMMADRKRDMRDYGTAILEMRFWAGQIEQSVGEEEQSEQIFIWNDRNKKNTALQNK